MLEQKQLGFGVHGGALHVGGQPGTTDLRLVRFAAAAPPPQLHQPCAADDAPVRREALGERDCRVVVAQVEQPVDVPVHRLASRRNLGELVRRPIGAGGGGQFGGVVILQRHQLDVLAA
jgi:hypothetical protein